MKIYLFYLLMLTGAYSAFSKNIHVVVALCDNENQGIVPVPEKLGNGQDPVNNLYWGAMYGVKSFFRYKAPEWEYLGRVEKDREDILERVLFKHKTSGAYMLADAYDGRHIKKCTEDVLLYANAQNAVSITHEGKKLSFGGDADLLAYIGHDGLMEFKVTPDYKPTSEKKEIIILACASREFFKENVKKAGAQPLLWTTGLMAPEAYTLHAAINGWLVGETGKQIDERAAQAYHKYQKCGINGARRLFATGFE